MLMFQCKHFLWFPQHKFYMVTSQVLNNGGQNLEKQSNDVSNNEDSLLQVIFPNILIDFCFVLDLTAFSFSLSRC